MTLAIGTRLGAYEVLGLLGEGGMGQVYRARDSKLNRQVALKVLPADVVGDPDRVARFKREAHVLASLNHPNIAAIYGLEEGDGSRLAASQTRPLCLVMELVEGPTLQETLAGAGGALAWPDALPIVRQIAAALEAAHEQDIIHRDLKPANIKVREDGAVKVLDFGLAKALTEDRGPGTEDRMNSPTLTARATQLGMILGTAAYMAPEQAKGRAVDRRADIWAFGVVLYEMLTGTRAFDGDDVSDVMASVLKSDPEWTRLPAHVPPAVRRLLARCLQKDPKRRLRDIAEGMLRLDEDLAGASASAASAVEAPTAAAPPAAVRPLWRRALPIAAAVVVTAAAVAAVFMLRTSAPPVLEPVTFAFAPAASAPLALSPANPDLAISHDGRLLVYCTLPAGGGSVQLHVRPLNQLEPRVLQGTTSSVAPFFSADDQWIGFVDSANTSRLKKTSVLGGPIFTVVTAPPSIAGGAWLPDGQIVIGQPTGLKRVTEGASALSDLTTLEPGEIGHRWPALVDGTKVVLFSTATGTVGTTKLAAVDVATGKVVRFKLTGTAPRYSPSGHMVYVTADGSLMAVPFDPRRMEVTGSPVPVVSGIALKSTGSADFDISTSGHLVYVIGGSMLAERTISWVDRRGKETPTKAPPRTYYYARVSPDNAARLSLDIRDQEQDLWIWDERGSLMRLTSNEGADQYGIWTPDGQHVIYQSAGVKNGLFWVKPDGASAPELLVERPAAYPNAVSPDGATLVFRASGTMKNDLFTLPLRGDRTAKTLLATEHDELNAALSPDGRWLAFQSDLSGLYEIYVRPFPDVAAGQTLVSIGGGSKPVWAPKGLEIFYISADARKLMSVPMSASPAGKLIPSAPVELLDVTPYFFGAVGRNYDVSPDGTRFVMIKNGVSAAGASPSMTVVLNWADTLRRK